MEKITFIWLSQFVSFALAQSNNRIVPTEFENVPSSENKQSKNHSNDAGVMDAVRQFLSDCQNIYRANIQSLEVDLFAFCSTFLHATPSDGFDTSVRRKQYA